MFINLSNHPSSKWSKEQLDAARQMSDGGIIDIPFPNIDPRAKEADIFKLAREYTNRILALKEQPLEHTVHVMGEMTFTYTLVNILQLYGMTCVASTTERNVTENPDGSKTVSFRFVRFRFYN